MRLRKRHVHRWERYTPTYITPYGEEAHPGQWFRCRRCGESGFDASEARIAELTRLWQREQLSHELHHGGPR